MTDDPLLAEVLDAIPESLRGVSGGALYSGREAWTNPSPLYLMGINPGGDPADLSVTVAKQAAWALRPDSFAAYRDEAWKTSRGNLYAPGKHPMQRSVLHLLDQLGLDPAKVPTSNMVYARSRQARDIASNDMRAWAEECWPFHSRMIERLRCRVVVCMGQMTANFVRSKFGSHTQVDEFIEDNRRRTPSRVYVGGSVIVVQAAHPSRSCWYTEACDLSPLVLRALSADHANFSATTVGGPA